MKKSILILPSIVLLFLVNACTPLPTGGPVSSNVIYKLYNQDYTLLYSMETTDNDTINFDINNDGIIDFNSVQINTNLFFKALNNATFATKLDTNNLDVTRPYSFMESINTNDSWNSDSIYFAHMYFYGVFVSEILPLNPLDNTAIIGIRIKNGNNYNYGWIRVYFHQENLITASAKIIESAYNTIPNQQILAGKK